jgi:hypothetical protein
MTDMAMKDWSISDFEVHHDGLVLGIEALSGVLNQPRCLGPRGTYLLGADSLDEIRETALSLRVDDLAAVLHARRFEDPADDDRRVRLLLRIEMDRSGKSVAELVQMALDQSVRPAA